MTNASTHSQAESDSIPEIDVGSETRVVVAQSMAADLVEVPQTPIGDGRRRRHYTAVHGCIVCRVYRALFSRHI